MRKPCESNAQRSMSHYAHSDTIVTVPNQHWSLSQHCLHNQHWSLSQRYSASQHCAYSQHCVNSQHCGHYRAEYFRHDMRILRGTRRKETQQA